MTDKTQLIVSGIARSGTTALAELLNSHPRVCVGIERFKFRYLLENDYSLELLEKKRFFDFRERDTNLRPAVRPAWVPTYEAMAQKWDGAQVIGDKVPDLTPVLADLMDARPATRCIYILRNLKDVGLSWQARANRTRDAWPRDKGFVMACDSWAAQMRQLEELLASRPDLAARTLLLDYDRIYDADTPTEAAILSFLGVDPDPAFSETFATHRAFRAAKSEGTAQRKVPKQFREAYGQVDMRPARRLRRQAQDCTLARAEDLSWPETATAAAPTPPAAAAPQMPARPGRKARRLAAGRPKGTSPPADDRS